MYDVFGMFKQLFKWRAEANDGDSRTAISLVKELDKLRKCSDIGEELIQLTDDYVLQFSEKDFKKYNKLVVKFFKHN